MTTPLSARAPRIRGARALFTGRPGGVSTGEHAGLNLARHVGDDETAVERNRARRVMREIFRKNAPNFSKACDIIIFMRRGWSKFDFKTLDEKFANAASAAIRKIDRAGKGGK